MHSENEAAKKGKERQLADWFVEARADAIGKALVVAHGDENPDFLCEDDDGRTVGLEVAQITRGPVAAHWAWILDGETELEPFDAQAMIYELLGRKERARRERYSIKVKDCILLLVLVENSLPNLRVALDGLEDDFAEHGFEEVWLMDISEQDAYGTVELFGLFPTEVWGHHVRPNAGSKPFG